MKQEKLDRISFLYKKSQSEGLTPEEKAEQKELRDEYRKSVVGNLTSTLNNTYLKRPNGRLSKLKRKK